MLIFIFVVLLTCSFIYTILSYEKGLTKLFHNLNCVRNEERCVHLCDNFCENQRTELSKMRTWAYTNHNCVCPNYTNKAATVTKKNAKKSSKNI